MRNHAVEASRTLTERGYSWPAVAGFLHLEPRTLRLWRYNLAHTCGLIPLGRPAVRSPREQRDEVIHFIDELGPGLGVPSLRECFPLMARAELADLLRRYRRVWQKRHQQPLRILHWTRLGSVWAIDFTEEPALIDGHYRYLLAVRDLASGQQLLWQPVRCPTADEVGDALAFLFARHGPPLVLKSDNGSPFDAASVQELARHWGVELLFSPPYTPRYNGAIEAGIGSLKTRTDHHAARHDRPGQWSYDDVAAAQWEANATARPHGPNGPSPEQTWADRQRLSPEERTLFRASVERLRQEIDGQQGPPQQEMPRRARDRQAIRRALEEHGYLWYTRRRIPLPIRQPNAASIT